MRSKLQSLLITLCTGLAVTTGYANAQDWTQLDDIQGELTIGSDPRIQLWAEKLNERADKLRETGGTIFVDGEAFTLKDNEVEPILFSGVAYEGTVVSFGLFGGECDNGEQGRAAGKIVHSICPVRVRLTNEDAPPRTFEFPKACVVWRSLLDTKSEDSYTYYRVHEGQVEFRAVMDGVPIEDCNHSYEID